MLFGCHDEMDVGPGRGTGSRATENAHLGKAHVSHERGNRANVTYRSRHHTSAEDHTCRARMETPTVGVFCQLGEFRQRATREA